MDIRGVDSGGEGTTTPCLHLHHHGGLPGALHLYHLHRLLQTSQGSLHQVVED